MINKISAQNYIRNQQLQQKLGLKKLTSDELKSLQNVLLEIFIEIQRICSKYSLTVFLGGGSALGAVRHKGFIPWDDDMDLMMLRNDYELFIGYFKKEANLGFKLKESGFSLHIIKEKTLYVGPMTSDDDGGIYIDIFPIDYVPLNKVSRWIKGICSDLLLFILNSKGIYQRDNIYLKGLFMQTFSSCIIYYGRKMIGCIFSKVSVSKLRKLHYKIISYSKISTLVTIPTGRKHYFGELLPYTVFFPPKESEFEHLSCQLPNKIDTYLSNLYGKDYMELPPIEKRETHPCISFSCNN